MPGSLWAPEFHPQAAGLVVLSLAEATSGGSAPAGKGLHGGWLGSDCLVFSPPGSKPHAMADNELSAKLSKKGSLPPGSSPGDATEPSILLQKLKSTIS